MSEAHRDRSLQLSQISLTRLPSRHGCFAGYSPAVFRLVGHRLSIYDTTCFSSVSRVPNHHLLKWQPEHTLGPIVDTTKHAFPRIAIGPLWLSSLLDIPLPPGPFILQIKQTLNFRAVGSSALSLACPWLSPGALQNISRLQSRSCAPSGVVRPFIDVLYLLNINRELKLGLREKLLLKCL